MKELSRLLTFINTAIIGSGFGSEELQCRSAVEIF